MKTILIWLVCRWMTPPCSPTCQTCPSHSPTLKEGKLALVFLAGQSLKQGIHYNVLFLHACSKHLVFDPSPLRATPEPQEELTASNIPPTLSSSRMLHRLVFDTHSHPFPQNPVSVLALTYPLSCHSSRQSTWGILSTQDALKEATPQKCLSFKQSTWGIFQRDPVHLQETLPQHYQFSQAIHSHQLPQTSMNPGTPLRPLNCPTTTGWISLTIIRCRISRNYWIPNIFVTGATVLERQATPQRRQSFYQEGPG